MPSGVPAPAGATFLLSGPQAGSSHHVQNNSDGLEGGTPEFEQSQAVPSSP